MKCIDSISMNMLVRKRAYL